jgi:hypothetical protein
MPTVAATPAAPQAPPAPSSRTLSAHSSSPAQPPVQLSPTASQAGEESPRMVALSPWSCAVLAHPTRSDAPPFLRLEEDTAPDFIPGMGAPGNRSAGNSAALSASFFTPNSHRTPTIATSRSVANPDSGHSSIFPMPLPAVPRGSSVRDPLSARHGIPEFLRPRRAPARNNPFAGSFHPSTAPSVGGDSAFSTGSDLSFHPSSGALRRALTLQQAPPRADAAAAHDLAAAAHSHFDQQRGSLPRPPRRPGSGPAADRPS